MRELPSGTVTFLFSDVEGSTRLLREHGKAYAELLGEHRTVLRDAFAQHGGVEVDTQGDAFFVAFARASDALAAAAESQATLRGGPISVRIGLHTGEPIVTSEGYVGMDVHRAARIAAAGHGGQVLLSQATRDLVRDEEAPRPRRAPAEGPVRAGARLPARPRALPPLKSLRQTNLPVPATPFLGRTRELEEVVGLLRDDGVRLLTLTGPGGTGQDAPGAAGRGRGGRGRARRHLVGVRSRRSAIPRSRSTRSRRRSTCWSGRASRSRRRSPSRSRRSARCCCSTTPSTSCRRWRSTSHASVRLDGPKLLVTSRERLQLQGEHAWSVPSLDDRDGPALFTARARALRPAFSETTATPSSATGSTTSRSHSSSRLRASRSSRPSSCSSGSGSGSTCKGGRDADPRQQTLDATIRWSYDLLSPEEQRLFVRLAVFVGGCTFEAAEAVCDAEIDTLQSLIDKSLVRSRDVAGRARYWMLETIREFAVEAARNVG